MKRCRICGEEKKLDLFPIDRRNKDGRWGICRVCQRGRKRQWQASWSEESRNKHHARSREWAVRSDYDRRRDKEKIMARRQLQKAVLAGKIERGDCEVCGSPNTQGHHQDYKKPLEVSWLCSRHHAELHRVQSAHG